MREPNSLEEVTPVRLNTSELRIMALRQQQQIDTQQQLLAAREQRLRFLKAQEACETVAAAEGERLRRLRERVEAQESKLRRLRALRGQVDLQKTYNVTLGNDLDSIRALFSEKEKELTLAVAKVEALTRQLEELRRDRRGTLNLFTGLANHSQLNSSPATIELEKLRRELMYRNQLSLQQDARLHLQREALQKRQAELQSVDQRILELQGRLNKKRTSNIIQHQQSSSTQLSHSNNLCANHVRSVSTSFYPQQRVPRSNIVAVEPFNHVPQKSVALANNTNKMNILNNNSNVNNAAQNQAVQDSRQFQSQMTSNFNLNEHNMAAESDENKLARQKKQEHVLKNATEYEHEPTFSAMEAQISDVSKLSNSHDQMMNNKTAYVEHDIHNDELILNNRYDYNEHNSDNKRNNNNDAIDNQQLSSTNDCDSDKVSDMNGFSSRAQVTATVHSTPLSFVNKSVAVPVTLSNLPLSNDEQKALNKSKAMQSNNKGFAYSLLHNIPSGNLVVPPRKPNNSASPLAAKHNSHDIKINMVTPQTQNQHISQSEDSADKLKPTLPPKPNKNNTQTPETDSGQKAATESNNEYIPTGTNIPSKANIGNNPSDNLPIKAKPLTIKKSPHSEQPRLKHISNSINAYKVQHSGSQRMLESSYLLTENAGKSGDDPLPESLLITDAEKSDNANRQLEYKNQQTQRPTAIKRLNIENSSDINNTGEEQSPDKKLDEVSRRKRSFISAVLNDGKIKLARRVSFDPLALLLDASLEGELELVQKTALQVPNPSAANDEGITALHNAICAGHVEIVKFLVNFGCDVNAQDSDGWTPLHCAASCNNLSMVKFLVESGACLFAATLSDHETPAEKCEEDEEGFDGCSEYLYSIQEKLGILNSGEVYAVFSYDAQQPDELSFSVNDKLTVIRKGDESEREWWWAKDCNGREGYIPRNLLGFFPRVTPCSDNHLA